MGEAKQQPAFSFGEWIVEPQLNRIRRDEEDIRLEPRSVDVLRYLLERPGEVVSTDELLDSVWAGQIVEPNAVQRHITRLRQALKDDSHSPAYIETISKRGYRAIGPVTTLAATSPQKAVTAASETSGLRKPARYWRSLTAGIAGSALVVAVGWWASRDATDQAPRPVLPKSVAVLPLENLSPDPDDAYFADGMHEEILNQLTKVQGLLVIARTSVRKYEDTALSIPEIAQELNVGSVLEGSVRYAGSEVRITAQLVDSTTGSHLWSETYDRDLSEIFSIQSDVATQIALALGQTLSPQERQQIEALPTNNLEAYKLYVKALSMLQNFAPLDPVHAELNRAIALDPTFAQALALKSFLYANQASTPVAGTAITPENVSRYTGLAADFADRALALDSNQAMAYLVKSGLAEHQLRWDEGLAYATKAYQTNPNHPFVRLIYARSLAGRKSADAPRVLEMVLERDPQNPAMFHGVADYYDTMENKVRAFEVQKRAVELAPSVPIYQVGLANIAATIGEDRLALESAARAEALHRESTSPSTLDAVIYAQLIYCYARLNQRADAQRLLAKLGDLPAGAVPELFGGVYLSLGLPDQAVSYFRQALDEGYPWMRYELAINRNHSKFDLIRKHPGFQEMLKEVPAAY